MVPGIFGLFIAGTLFLFGPLFGVPTGLPTGSPAGLSTGDTASRTGDEALQDATLQKDGPADDGDEGNGAQNSAPPSFVRSSSEEANSAPDGTRQSSAEPEAKSGPRSGPRVRPGDPVGEIGDPEPPADIKGREDANSGPPRYKPGPPRGLAGDAQPGWAGAVVESPSGGQDTVREPARNPLGTGAAPGQLSPTERLRARGAGERFLKVAYGAWGGGSDQREYYERAVTQVVSDPERFYDSPAGEDTREMARAIEKPGVYASVDVKDFEALTESPEMVRCRVRFAVGGMIGQPQPAELKLTVVRDVAKTSANGSQKGWKVAEASGDVPDPLSHGPAFPAPGSTRVPGTNAGQPDDAQGAPASNDNGGSQ